MTRLDLMRKSNMLMRNSAFGEYEQVNTCKAWIIYSPDRSLAIIKSYRIAVAIYSATTRNLYVFDFYSNTTQRHIRKAASILDPHEIVYLYQRSDNVIVYLPHSDTVYIKKSAKNRKFDIETGYSIYIENDWNY